MLPSIDLDFSRFKLGYSNLFIHVCKLYYKCYKYQLSFLDKS